MKRTLPDPKLSENECPLSKITKEDAGSINDKLDEIIIKLENIDLDNKVNKSSSTTSSLSNSAYTVDSVHMLIGTCRSIDQLLVLFPCLLYNEMEDLLMYGLQYFEYISSE